ncbi:hypothetical protein SSPO_000670 [Streptomyces antimycoticus]|uniref:Uncharacterized protein n=1 Tax=Streptomyces antimycoticus TaxID=68175 RepID=A0A499UJW4_9ACTN|nr:hypothetical protein SSPO_000670 [Streptomyces antimycoticus]
MVFASTPKKLGVEAERLFHCFVAFLTAASQRLLLFERTLSVPCWAVKRCDCAARQPIAAESANRHPSNASVIGSSNLVGNEGAHLRAVAVTSRRPASPSFQHPADWVQRFAVARMTKHWREGRLTPDSRAERRGLDPGSWTPETLGS